MEIGCLDLGNIHCTYGKTEKGLVYLVNKKDPLTDEEVETLMKKYGAKKYFDFNNPKFQNGKYLLDVAESSKPILVKDSQGFCVIPLLFANGVSEQTIFANMPRYIGSILGSWKKEHPSWFMYLRGREFTGEDIKLFSNCLGKQEFSCGAVILNGREVLIEHMVQKHISLPKGHVEDTDETYFGTACREVKEETGLEIRKIDNKTYKIHYSPSEGIVKRVIFYLAEVTGGEEVAQAEEVSAIEWVDIDLAIEMVTYETDKKVLRWAKSCLKL